MRIKVRWLRVIATVLTSKLLFVASCTSGILMTANSPGLGRSTERGYPPDPFMSVIAVVPGDRAGETKVVATSLRDLETFKKREGGYSFLPSHSRGEIGAEVDDRTTYTVTKAASGEVFVETRNDQNDNHVTAKYLATDRDIKVISTRSTNDFIEYMTGMVIGIPLAIAIAFIGYLMGAIVERVEKKEQA